MQYVTYKYKNGTCQELRCIKFVSFFFCDGIVLPDKTIPSQKKS